MSQAGIINTSSGPVPPQVPTSFVTNDGTAIPAANILNVKASFDALVAQQDTEGGLATFADPNLSNNLYITRTNIFLDSFNTANAIPVTAAFVPLTNIGTYIVRCDVAAYADVIFLGATFSIFAGIRSDGITAVLINPSDIVANIEPDPPMDRLNGINAVIDVSGLSIAITVTGVAATSINWKIVGTYQFIGATI